MCSNKDLERNWKEGKKLAFTAFNRTESFSSGHCPTYLGLKTNQVHYFGINSIPAG